jgi:hypothetical protein
MMSSRPDVEPAIKRLSQRIRKLQYLLDEVYSDAVYLGMTPEIARDCDERRRRIAELTEHLFVLRTDPESL